MEGSRRTAWVLVTQLLVLGACSPDAGGGFSESAGAVGVREEAVSERPALGDEAHATVDGTDGTDATGASATEAPAGEIEVGAAASRMESEPANATTYLGVLVGPGDGGHDGVGFYGTDLGFTYEHLGKTRILFGDTWADAAGTLIGGESGNDDAAGTIDCTDGDEAETYVPDVDLGATDTRVDSIQYSHRSDFLKTPMAGFSNGTDEYALFYTGKPRGCRVDADCGLGLTCDRGLGFAGEEYYDERALTLGCVDGRFGCLSDTMADAVGWPVPDTGFCIDTTSSQYQDNDAGRIASIATRVHVGVRLGSEDVRWVSHEWLTSKFQNVTARVGKIDGVDKVLLWGRPGFVAVGARGRRADLYFAYADMPSGNPDFDWRLHYFTGMTDGRPTFATDESLAVAVDRASHDVVNQQSVAYEEALGVWVMLYGGGITNRPWLTYPRCGALEVLAGADCLDVDRGNGAIRISRADAPWGPWSSPEDVLVGGDPGAGALDQYAPGGVLRHPDCVGVTCAQHSPGVLYGADEYGFLYGANLIDGWTEPRDDGSVDLYWNVSAWDPYNVVLFKTRVR